MGLAELWAVQDQIRLETARLGEIEARIESASGDAEAGRNHLQNIQAQILGAEDIVLLESFALYEPKYPFTNSLEYKQRLAVIREDQKQTARGLSAEVDQWDSHAMHFDKAQWKKLRKDALKLALRSFNSESEYCVDNVKFSNLQKMEERIRRSFDTGNKLLKNTEAWFTELVLNRKLE